MFNRLRSLYHGGVQIARLAKQTRPPARAKDWPEAKIRSRLSASAGHPSLFHPRVCLPDFMFYRRLTAAGATASALSAVPAASVRISLSGFHAAQNVPDQITGITADCCNQNHIYQNSHIQSPFCSEKIEPLRSSSTTLQSSYNITPAA